MRTRDVLNLAGRSLRWGFAIAYMLVLALATACVYFAGAIWVSVAEEKQEPCELTVTAPSYLEITEQTIQDVLALDGVKGASGLLELSASVTSGSYTANLHLTGIDGDYLDVTYTQGGMFPEESAMPWLVLTETAAKSFADPDKKTQEKTDELPPIDWLGADFALQTGEMTVTAGVSGLIEGQEAAAYISRDMAKELLQRQGQSGRYTAAVVRIRNIGAAEAVTEQITALGYQVENMDTARQEKWDSQLREALYLLLLGTAVLACAAFMKKVDALKNRDGDGSREQALRWMGMEEGRIRALRAVQQLFLSAGGAALGITICYILAAAIPPELRDASDFALTLPAAKAAMVFASCAAVSQFIL